MSDLSQLNKLCAIRHRKAAVQARKEGEEGLAVEEFEEALHAIDEAIEVIESPGKLNPSMSGQIDQATKDRASELADCWGIRGGIYREAGEIEKAIDAYDKGYEFESNPKYEINSTYNTVNRVVLRLLSDSHLLQPGTLSASGNSGQKPIEELLGEAVDAIEQKWSLMTDPVWALADMVLVKTLLQAQDAAEWEARFKSRSKERFPFDSLRAVVKRLANAERMASDTLRELAARLDAHVAEKWPPQEPGSNGAMR